MASWTRETVQELLQEKMNAEVQRLRRKGHKTSIDDLAKALAPFVIGLMSDARRREVGRVLKEMNGNRNLEAVLNERRRELKVMAEALWCFAESLENR